MNNYLHRTLLISLILCATLFSSGLQAQIQITTKTLNSLRPAKADVKAIESGIENVQQQVANKGNAGQISGDITYLEEKVAKVRRDFKRFKKLPEWDASLAELKKQQAVLAGDQAAASKAKKDKNNAIYQLAYSLRNTGLESDIEKYRSNPEMKNAHEVVAGFSNLAQKLEKFRESYPNETEHKDVKRALAAESYVKGEFVSSYIGGLKEERVESDKLIASVRVEAPMRAERIVTKRISQGVKAVAAFPDQSYFSKMLETDRKLAKELKNYQENGDFEAYLLDQV
ncbi:MAG TPA: hypothetical protein ENJ82_11755, partial [Bacteroidetes bacterium]|nr:hypothetical protein [Bacteroidota bacterium]